MFGNKKKIEYLESRVEYLTSRLDEEIKNRQKLGRIVKMAKDDKPTIDIYREHYYSGKINTYVYLYINKCEYKIWLKELSEYKENATLISNSHFKLDVDGDIAYLTHEKPGADYIETFIIDYLKEVYVYTIKKKEETECTDY